MRVIIAGGGIGGLVSALSLHELGYEVDVYEAVPVVKPLGVGINVLPHAVRELMELGLGPALEHAGILTAELAYFSKHGKPIWAEPRGREAGYGWPQISIHRGRLHMLLLETVQARLGSDRLHLGHALDRFEQNASGVTAYFVDRDGAPLATAHGDVLIGADGIHSRTRRQLFPDEGAPRWNGTLLWRGVTAGAPFLTGRSMIMAGHETQKFVAYPIGQESDGRATVNWIAELKYAPGECTVRETWNAEGELSDFLPRFQGWKFDWLDVPALIEGAPEVYVWPLVDRDPLPHWCDGRVTLLGDAAHPMYPVGSNGASQAVLDARVLTSCLRDARDGGDIPGALAKYERVRRPSTAALTLANREQGPEICMSLVEARAPDGFTQVTDVVSHDELAAISSKYKRLAGFSVDELNQRPSLAAVKY